MCTRNEPGLFVVGAGPAGLMAAIQAARQQPGCRVTVLERGPRPGRKLLLSGGGRCNLSNTIVRPADFAGAEPKEIDRVLRALTVEQTLRFFAESGVDCYEEDAGKLFPTSDRAGDVLNALLKQARAAGVRLLFEECVLQVLPVAGGFVLRCSNGDYSAQRVILACGGCSLPRTGSDGKAFGFLRQLKLPLNEPLLPGLVPFRLPARHPLTTLSGVTQEVELSLVLASGKVLARSRGPLLLTHQGASGPAVLDLSRHVLVSRSRGEHAVIRTRWCLLDREDLEQRLQGAKSLAAQLDGLLPARLLDCLLRLAGLESTQQGSQLKREQRRRLYEELSAGELPLRSDLGWSVAKVTAGGVPLSACSLKSLELKDQPGLYLCGEMLDVDGREGGFNLQWAWSSGTMAGRAAASACVIHDPDFSRRNA